MLLYATISFGLISPRAILSFNLSISSRYVPMLSLCSFLEPVGGIMLGGGLDRCLEIVSWDQSMFEDWVYILGH